MRIERDQSVFLPDEVWSEWNGGLLDEYEAFEAAVYENSGHDYESRVAAVEQLYDEPGFQALDIELQALRERKNALFLVLLDWSNGSCNGKDVVDITEQDGVRCGVTRLGEAALHVVHDQDERWLGFGVVQEEMEHGFASVVTGMRDYVIARGTPALVN